MSDRLRPFTSRVSSFIKTNVDQVRAGPPSGSGWGDWAGQKLKQITTRGDAQLPVEKLYIFPGWAARRYRENSNQPIQAPSNVLVAPFDIEVSVHGWASSHSSPDVMTRSQRAFIRVAKAYAKLPNILSTEESEEDILKHLPPTPSQMTSEEIEIVALEEQLRKAEMSDPGPSPETVASSSTALSQLHRNLESRILPFWSSVLPGRMIRLSLYVSSNGVDPSDGVTGGYEPVVVQQTSTSQDGSFSLTFTVPWERMCAHAQAYQIAYGDPNCEYELFVHSELLAVPIPQRNQPGQPPLPREPLATVASITSPVSLSHSPIRVISDIDDTVKFSHILHGARCVFYNVFVKELSESVITEMSEWYNSMWTRGVRFHYVSNGPFELLPLITDFIALSRLPVGSIKLRSYTGRALFNGIMAAPSARKRANVVDVLDHFPQSRFILVGDSGEQDLELYAQLAQERPRQILAVFIRDVSTGDGITPALEDPTGVRRKESSSSLEPPKRLSASASRDYWQTASTVPTTPIDTIQPPPPVAYAQYRPRSRAGSGSSVQSQLPASPGDSYMTGGRSPVGGFYVPALMNVSLSEEPEYLESGSRRTSLSSQMPLPSPISRSVSVPPMTEPERRQYDLQARVDRARALMPPQVPLRVFRHPSECVEAGGILDRLRVGIGR